MFRKFLCFIGDHEREFRTLTMSKNENIETGEGYYFCKHCNWKSERVIYLSGWLNPIKFKV